MFYIPPLYCAGISSRLAKLGPGSSLYPVPPKPLQLLPPHHPTPNTPAPATDGALHGVKDTLPPTHDHHHHHHRAAVEHLGLPPTTPTAEDNSNPFTRHSRPQPRLRHRRPPASRSSKYRDWGGSSSNNKAEEGDTIALTHTTSADLRSSRLVPNSYR